MHHEDKLDFDSIADELNYEAEIRKELDEFDPDDPSIEWKRPKKTILIINDDGTRTLKMIFTDDEDENEDDQGNIARFSSEDEWNHL
jgi:hypothetical protein